jgi:two-component system copper resistance phosphate regulon response regulator CusR
MRVLVAEDDRALLSVLERGLREQGYVLDTATRGDDALHLLRLYEYAAAIVDWRLPGMPGDEVIRELRRLGIPTSVLMLTARDTTADKVQGLDAGADDYLVKPVDFPELLARLRALLRRPREVGAPVLSVGSLRLDPGSRAVSLNGRSLQLTARELAIAELLMRRSPAAVSRLAIARHAWDDESDALGSNTIDVHVGHLRQKLSGGDISLLTVRGAGYRLVTT